MVDLVQPPSYLEMGREKVEFARDVVPLASDKKSDCFPGSL
jgi:hypothetical protein